jgi:hypothetical protein
MDMGKYLLAYSGGSMPDSPEEQQAVMQQWGAWFGQLGAGLVDGGAPVGASVTIKPGGAVADGAATAISGYSILEAPNLGEATTMAQGCPLLHAGGTVEVYETVPMM